MSHINNRNHVAHSLHKNTAGTPNCAPDRSTDKLGGQARNTGGRFQPKGWADRKLFEKDEENKGP